MLSTCETNYILPVKIMDWISFDEQRPHDGQRCLVCCKPLKRVIILTYNFVDGWWNDDKDDAYFCNFNNVDYWCPLPDYKK